MVKVHATQIRHHRRSISAGRLLQAGSVRWRVAVGLLTIALAQPNAAAETSPGAPLQAEARLSPAEILPPGRWATVNRSIDRALGYIAAQQEPDGSFRTVPFGQPAVTSLCVLAFMSRGHLPGQGRYWAHLDKAIDYVISCQHEDGLLSVPHPRMRRSVDVAQVAAYNHAVAGLMLSEAYGMCSLERNRTIRPAIEAAIEFALQRHPQPKRHAEDQGGWRYLLRHQHSDSDLAVTSWYLMFLRSCRNAGFEVPVEVIDEALEFVKRCYDPEERIFWYALRGRERVKTRGMVGAGILSLSLAGEHETEMARHAGQWLLEHPFDRYMDTVGNNDRFFYAAFYCSHAMFQLGGRYWSEFYPVMAQTLVDGQQPSGAWDKDKWDGAYGEIYSTAMAVLALSPPHQLLPIFQR